MTRVDVGVGQLRTLNLGLKSILCTYIRKLGAVAGARYITGGEAEAERSLGLTSLLVWPPQKSPSPSERPCLKKSSGRFLGSDP